MTPWPQGESEMVRLIRERDWAATPLGAPATWPERLKAIVEAMLATRQIASLAVGPDRIFLYNDEASRQYGERHPSVLGRPIAEAFPHEFDKVAPFYDRVFAGESIHAPAQPLDPSNTGRQEIFDAFLTPVRDGEGKVIAAYMNGSATGDRLRAEAALQASESRYKRLFDIMGQGYGECEAIRDADGRAVDYRLIAVNPALRRVVGLTAEEAEGRTVRKGAPWIEDRWFEIFDAVVRKGEPKVIEFEAPPVSRWYQLNVYPLGEDRLAVLFEDTTERKRRELNTAFLDSTTKDLALRSTPDEIMTLAAARITEYLRLTGCVFADVDNDEQEVIANYGWMRDGAPTVLRRRFRFSEYVTEELRRSGHAGEPFVVRDTQRDPRVNAENYATLGAGAIAIFHFHWQGRWTNYLAVADAKARDWRDDEIALLQEMTDRIFLRRERARAEAALRESEARFQQFAAASSGALWIRNAATLSLEYASPAIATVYGVAPDALMDGVEPWASAIVPDDREAALERLERARRGEAVVHEYRIQRASDRAFRWIRDSDFPLLDAAGGVERIGGIAEDVTEAKLAVEHQSVLLAELQHRVRNIMAIIRSITARTGERAESVPEYSRLMAGRLLALARVQALLTRSANVSVSVANLVHDEVSAQAQHQGQYVLEGPDVELSPKSVEVLTLAVHELATNALKYGALSVPHGKVNVNWTTFEARGEIWLSFDWTEAGAPDRPAAPRRRGFGSELIEGLIPYELGGRGKLAIAPGGARCHLEFPLKAGASILETNAPRRAVVSGGAIDMAGEERLGGQRIMVAEDDFYLASDAARALRGAGAEVLGPFSTEEAARQEIIAGRLTGAVVDVNLGAGPSFTLARLLKDRGIPFVFVTGYDMEVIPAEFAGVARLQKPVELRQIVARLAEAAGDVAKRA